MFSIAAALLPCEGCHMIRPVKNGDSAVTAAQETRFEELYARWQTAINVPAIQLSSSTGRYIRCKPFADMEAMGETALPYMMRKIKEGDASGWKESQFFLWHAVKTISGVDLSGGGIAGEQEIARKYIVWWDDRNK
jgi:hypothetical protein